MTLLVSASILLLSLAAWAFFYVMGWPLQPGETAVVVGFCALVVLAVRAVAGKIRAGQKKTTL